jgi:hypothetical protein
MTNTQATGQAIGSARSTWRLNQPLRCGRQRRRRCYKTLQSGTGTCHLRVYRCARQSRTSWPEHLRIVLVRQVVLCDGRAEPEKAIGGCCWCRLLGTCQMHSEACDHAAGAWCRAWCGGGHNPCHETSRRDSNHPSAQPVRNRRVAKPRKLSVLARWSTSAAIAVSAAAELGSAPGTAQHVTAANRESKKSGYARHHGTL